MEPTNSLAQTFLARVDETVGFRLRNWGSLEEVLATLCRGAESDWPTVPLDVPRFLAYLAERLSADGDPRENLQALPAGDLHLACACAHGDPDALEAFESEYLPLMGRALSRTGQSRAFLEEVEQIVRERLFVSVDGAPPRILQYRGQGLLGGWVCVMASRTALKLLRARGPRAVTFDEEAIGREAGRASGQAELEFIKTKYRKDFARAFKRAFLTLSSKEREMLRLHFVQGMQIQDIAAHYQVNRKTITRWMVTCRAHLAEQTRSLLSQRLHLEDSVEAESLMRVLQTQLDDSIAGLFSGTNA